MEKIHKLDFCFAIFWIIHYEMKWNLHFNFVYSFLSNLRTIKIKIKPSFCILKGVIWVVSGYRVELRHERKKKITKSLIIRDRVDPVLTRFQAGSRSLLYGKSSNDPAPRQLVFNPGKTITVQYFGYFACANPFLIRDKRLHERASSPQAGWPGLEKRASSASEPTRFQPASYNRNFFIIALLLISSISGLCLKIDFPLNEPTPGQPVSIIRP